MRIEGVRARINQNGRIVIPALIRKGMGLQLGDSVVLSVADGILEIVPLKAQARRMPETPRQPEPAGRGASDEPEDERLQEALGKAEEWLG